MRASRQRPVSQHGAQPHIPAPVQPPRRVFNCIVDDTALVAGVKKSTRNGIRQWVKTGQMRLFVPLHALEQLSRQKNGNTRHGEDVRETLQWLDEATSKYPHAVTLQGGDQYFQDWAEVERFVVPRTLFSENDHMDDVEPDLEIQDLPADDPSKLTLFEDGVKTPTSSAGSDGFGSASPSSLQSMRSSVSVTSPPTSPTKNKSSPVKPVANLAHVQKVAASSSAGVPLKLQPLFNYILWRIHQEIDPVVALESFIFLCNDPNKVNHAKGFDIRYKRLEQLRETIGREDRDFRNRQFVQNKENPHSVSTSTAAGVHGDVIDDDDDNEVVYKPPPRAPATMMPKQPPNVIDPNAFSRNPNVVAPSEPARVPPKSPHTNNVQPRQARSNSAASFSSRGAGRGHFRGSPRGRGSFPQGRSGFTPNGRGSNAVQPNGQIDPDSFSRPRGSGYVGRGGRKLWVPT